MSGTFVDSSVVIDAMSSDEEWSDWSQSQIEQAASKGRLWINGIVYAETGHRFDRPEQLELALAILGLQVLDIPKHAFFAAAQAFRSYRKRGGERSSMLPDFIIGAHAALLDVPLLTRDAKSFRKAFPGLEIVAPDKN
jgi:hypothetical protein